MGLRILGLDGTLELTCDGDHGLLEPVRQLFHADGYLAQHSTAMRAGWLERYSGGGRLWLGPCCSGKTVRNP